jgi:HK97 family phage portal protein
MKLPNWIKLGVKASATNRVILQNLRMPGGTIPHVRYDALSKESYERNVAVNLCVNLLSSSAASVPWVLYKNSGPGTKARRIMTKSAAYKAQMFQGVRRGAVLKALRTTEIESHPALSLLERPNEYQSHAEYMVWMLSYFLISGNSFEEFVAPNKKNAAPVEMFALRPDRTTIIPNTDMNRQRYPLLSQKVEPLSTTALGYNYSVGGRDDEQFAADSVLHRKFFHPTDDFYGLSPLQVAARYFRTDNLSADWNFALLQNQARPSGALVAPTTIGDDTYERLKQELVENYGGSNTGVPMILEGGFEWKQLGLSPLEMDWLSGTRDARSMICAIYHVPPEKIGDPEHRTYNSMPEAGRALWNEGVLPLLDMVRDSYNRFMIPRYGENLYLDYDRDQIDALADDQDKVWSRVEKVTFISVNEKREAVGFDDYEGDPELDPEASVPTALLPKPAGPVPFGGGSGELPGSKPNGAEPTINPPEVDPEVVDKPAASAKSIERKAQRLTSAQKSARARLRAGMASHYRKQGTELAAYLRREISKL